MAFFARNEPRSFLNREPSVEVPEVVLPDIEGVRRGIVSTLVEAETRRGVEIWLGSMRFRTDGVCFRVSPGFALDGSFLSASIAASVFCCTSRVSSASSVDFWDILGNDGSRVKIYGDGEVSGIVLRLDSPAMGGGEGTVGDDEIGLTKGSGSALSCIGSSSLVVVVDSSFGSSSPNSTWARSRLRRVLGDRSFSSDVEIGGMVVSRAVVC